jgi:hypothetical protein
MTPEEVVAAGRAEFGINWLLSLLASREAGLRPRTSPSWPPPSCASATEGVVPSGAGGVQNDTTAHIAFNNFT